MTIPHSELRIPNSDEPVLAVDIGGHKHGVALCTAGGTVLEALFTRTDLQADAAAITAGVLEKAARLREKHPAVFAAVRRCGIGFGGPVRDNRPYRSMHVGGWEGIDLCGMIRERFGVSAVMGNDGNVSALGEHRFGAGRGCSSLVYLTVSTGIGGGVILDNRLWAGAHGFAGELGHIHVRPDGPACSCGSAGCLEACCSGTALGRRAGALAAESPKDFAGLLESAGGAPDKIDAQRVFAAAAEGEPGPVALLKDYLDELARGVGSIINAFDVETVVIGGGVAKAGEALFAPLRERVGRYVMPMLRSTARIAPAALGDHTVILGATVAATRNAT
jgi:glucokinase